MSVRHHPSIESPAAVCLLVSANLACERELSRALAGQFIVEEAAPGEDIGVRVRTLRPALVLFDFAAPDTQLASSALQEARRNWPDLALLGVGLSSDPGATLAALRAGVDDFVDLSAAPEDILQIVRKFMTGPSLPAAVTGHLLMLLGARSGLGVSTIAGNLSILLREPGAAAGPGIALLDMGLPARDGLMYMDLRSEFSFVDGVRNLKRMDQTLLQTTLPRHADGVAVLPLPASLGQMRDVSPGDGVALVRRLRDFFEYQVGDFGGFSNLDFMSQMLGSCGAGDRIWVVCDQSLGGLVSTTQMLAELRATGVDTGRFGLIVNRFDPKVDIAAADIASRLGLKLEAVIPLCGAALLNAGSRGQMLANVNRKDPFVLALQGLLRQLPVRPRSTGGKSPSGGWVPKFLRPAGK